MNLDRPSPAEGPAAASAGVSSDRVFFEPTVDDITAANRLVFWRWLLKRWATHILLGGSVVGLAMTASVWTDPRSSKLVGFIEGFLLWLVVLGVFAAWNWALVPRKARRLLKQQKDLHSVIQYEWSEEGVSIVSRNSSARFEWSDFIDMAESSRVILLYRSDTLFNFLPKRVLSPAQAAAIVGKVIPGRA